MTGGRGGDREGFGSELRKRQTPQFARQERRRSFWTGMFGVVLGLMSLIVGLDAMRTGRQVAGQYMAPDLPGWAVVLIGLFILFISGFILWRFARKP